MTEKEFEQLITAILVAAHPCTDREAEVRFILLWAKYKRDYPDDGLKPLLEAAGKLGFGSWKDRPNDPTTLQHLQVATTVALKKSGQPRNARKAN
ncbi:hypothetical protein [Tepidicaulis sp.]|uniref:hypothetical protein n=1 Tax=Tepidicaulis sp. TaxID=1920809 RepID=UPI003B5B80F0